MNRRDLFKFMGAGAAALLVPELMLPKTTFFLPPSCGWGAQRLIIRKMQQYVIATSSYPIRYDATWDTADGGAHQYHVDFSDEGNPDYPQFQSDKIARMMLEDRMRHDNGIPNSDQFKLALPRGIVGKYI
jgi:hypothetical protein